MFNLQKNYSTAPRGQAIFAVQPGMLLSDQLAVIDHTYNTAEQKEYSISTLTSPLYINTTWSYLYNWYGQGKYGYLPSWVGPDQVGIWGDNLPEGKPAQHFFIVEDPTGIPEIYQTYAHGEQDAAFRLIDSRQFGVLTVQRRERLD